MPPVRKHIHTADFLHRIPRFLKKWQVPRQGGSFAGHVDKSIGFEVNDFKDRFGVDAIPWRVEDDDIGIVGQLGYFLHDVAGDERAVVKTVGFGVDSGSFDSFLDKLDTDDFFRHRGQDLGDGAGAAVQVKDGFILAVSDVIADNGIQLFCAQCIGLEKREGRDFEFQAEDFIVDTVLAVQDMQVIFFHHIGHSIVDGMEDPLNFAGQFKGQKQFGKIRAVQFCLGSGDQIDEDFSGLPAFPDNQMA